MSKLNEEYVQLLIEAQSGNIFAEEQLLTMIRKNYMDRKIYKYLNRNRQAENDDIRQEFMIGVALNIRRAKLDVGNPIDFLMNMGIYRVRTYMRKQIVQNTMQICNDCGKKTRLNMNTNTGEYTCKICGSVNIETYEINDSDETAIMSLQQDGFEDELVRTLILADFKATLTPGTNLYSLFELLESGIDKDNPLCTNYIKEIAKMWGGCSSENVVQNIKKLRARMEKWMLNNNVVMV